MNFILYVQVKNHNFILKPTCMSEPKYLKIQNFLKSQIQQGIYNTGDYLPSENELCLQFSITRTTARKALEELLKEGYIEKYRGKGSRVVERRKSLGLLTVKGFSEAVGENVKTLFLQKPAKSEWSNEIRTSVKSVDRLSECYYFERLRSVGNVPVMLEKNWLSAKALPGFPESGFVDNSFFKTLSTKYFIEVVGSTSEMRAELADKKLSHLLGIEPGSPILHISMQFHTTNKNLTVYAELYCNTQKFPVGNSYYI